MDAQATAIGAKSGNLLPFFAIVAIIVIIVVAYIALSGSGGLSATTPGNAATSISAGSSGLFSSAKSFQQIVNASQTLFRNQQQINYSMTVLSNASESESLGTGQNVSFGINMPTNITLERYHQLYRLESFSLQKGALLSGISRTENSTSAYINQTVKNRYSNLTAFVASLPASDFASSTIKIENQSNQTIYSCYGETLGYVLVTGFLGSISVEPVVLPNQSALARYPTLNYTCYRLPFNSTDTQLPLNTTFPQSLNLSVTTSCYTLKTVNISAAYAGQSSYNGDSCSLFDYSATQLTNESIGSGGYQLTAKGVERIRGAACLSDSFGLSLYGNSTANASFVSTPGAIAQSGSQSSPIPPSHYSSSMYSKQYMNSISFHTTDAVYSFPANAKIIPYPSHAPCT